MFRFFRKHSWILIVTLTLTIISFVVFMGKGPSRAGNGGSGGDYGTIYGHEINATIYDQARRDFFIAYWEQTHEWPDKSQGMTPDQLEQQVYSYLLMQLKAKDLGIHVGDDAAATAANNLLRSRDIMQLFGASQPVQPQTFIDQVLAPEGLTATDFLRAIRARVAINQLVEVLGLSGTLITPQEAGSLYDREYREYSAQAVFFSASNYLSRVTTSPAAIAQFYTNNQAAYREPDRRQVNYVVFNASNWVAQSKAEWAKTNFEETVESVYEKYGNTEQFAGGKTPEDTKAKIRELLINRRALADAASQANNFVSELYAMTPVIPQNLATLAKQKNLPVLTSAPFGESTGPEDFDAPEALTKAAFQLNADSPYTGPIPGSDAVYVIALANQLPSSIPSLAQIYPHVAQDFETQQAVALAQQTGTRFYFTATNGLATGKKFPQVAEAHGVTAVFLSPFSLSSSEVPELGDHAELGQLKQAAFTTAPGKVSPFVPTADGGFILYEQSLLPVDESKKATDFPQYLAQARRARQNEAFNLWLNTELNRELVNTPYYQQQAQARAAK
jgi:SurA N-terminal domain/PPIC-type PPIASE domain